MNVDEFKKITEFLVFHGNNKTKTNIHESYGLAHPILSERLFNLARYWALNAKIYSGNNEKMKVFTLWSESWKENVTEVKNLRESIKKELVKLRNNNCIFIPIKTTERQCKMLLKLDFENSAINKDEIAHWIIAVIFPRKKRLLIMDSLNNNKIVGLWKIILCAFMKDSIFVSCFYTKTRIGATLKPEYLKFIKKIIHQGASLNCGYFCCLYIMFTIKGFSIEKIQNSNVCNETYINGAFKTHIEKYMK